MYGPFCRGAIPAGAGKVQFIGRRCSTCAVCFFAVLRVILKILLTRNARGAKMTADTAGITCRLLFGARLAQANLTAQKAMREAQPELRQAFKSDPEGTAMPELRLRGMTPTA